MNYKCNECLLFSSVKVFFAVLDGSLLIVWGQSQLQCYMFPAHHTNLGLVVWHKIASKVSKETPSWRPQDTDFLCICEWDRGGNILYFNVLVILSLTSDKTCLSYPTLLACHQKWKKGLFQRSVLSYKVWPFVFLPSRLFQFTPWLAQEEFLPALLHARQSHILLRGDTFKE